MVLPRAVLRRSLHYHLCHAPRRLSPSTATIQLPRLLGPASLPRRFLSSTAPRSLPAHLPEFTNAELQQAAQKWKPPAFCPGCGAPSQNVDEKLPGYYPEKPRKRLLEQILRKEKTPRARGNNEDLLWEETIAKLKDDPRLLAEMGVQKDENGKTIHRSYQQKKEDEKDAIQIPHCQRCHKILHNNNAPPPPSYPTLKTLTTLLSNSPHKYNHIYHLVDAADFPLSLHRELRSYLYTSLPNKITRHLTVSYVITKCDVLMKKREQVTSLMSYFKNVIRDVIPVREKVESRTAPLHAISTRNGWDVGKLKEEIADRQGGVWFVGAVNVGKSSLLREVWPEGGVVRDMSVDDAAEFEILPDPEMWEDDTYRDAVAPRQEPKDIDDKVNWVLDNANRGGLPSVNAPQFPPAISEIPGTTVAPIRVGFTTKGRAGKFRGEIVDLPGLERWVGFGDTGLLGYVRPEKRLDIAPKKHPLMEQRTIKPGQSLLLGGLVMLTPKTPDTIFLMNPFTRLPGHIAATRKCINFLNHSDPGSALTSPDRLFQDPEKVGIVTPYRRFEGPGDVHTLPGQDGSTDIEFPSSYKSAGVFTLEEDVTILRNPMLEDRSPEAIDALPYKVFGTDIVLEGIGWVEITAQVKRDKATGEFPKLEVAVYSIEGKGVAQRRTMNAYPKLLEGARLAGKLKKPPKRPRLSKKGEKRRLKMQARNGGMARGPRGTEREGGSVW